MRKLLSSDDPPVYKHDKGLYPGVFLSAEHAGWTIPKSLNNLDSDIDFANVHFGCDIGINALVDEMDMRGFETLRCNYSRAVVDCVRMPDHPTLMAKRQDGLNIPGNINITQENRQQRIEEIYDVYHEKYNQIISEMELVYDKPRPLVISLHSMEKNLAVDSFGNKTDGSDRPETFFMFLPEQAHIAEPMAEYFIKRGVKTMGMNNPYCPKEHPTTLFTYYPPLVDLIVIERRNDLLRDPKDIKEWADLLGDAIRMVHEK